MEPERNKFEDTLYGSSWSGKNFKATMDEIYDSAHLTGRGTLSSLGIESRADVSPENKSPIVSAMKKSPKFENINAEPSSSLWSPTNPSKKWKAKNFLDSDFQLRDTHLSQRIKPTHPASIRILSADTETCDAPSLVLPQTSEECRFYDAQEYRELFPTKVNAVPKDLYDIQEKIFYRNIEQELRGNDANSETIRFLSLEHAICTDRSGFPSEESQLFEGDSMIGRAISYSKLAAAAKNIHGNSTVIEKKIAKISLELQQSLEDGSSSLPKSQENDCYFKSAAEDLRLLNKVSKDVQAENREKNMISVAALKALTDIRNSTQKNVQKENDKLQFGSIRISDELILPNPEQSAHSSEVSQKNKKSQRRSKTDSKPQERLKKGISSNWWDSFEAAAISDKKIYNLVESCFRKATPLSAANKAYKGFMEYHRDRDRSLEEIYEIETIEKPKQVLDSLEVMQDMFDIDEANYRQANTSTIRRQHAEASAESYQWSEAIKKLPRHEIQIIMEHAEADYKIFQLRSDESKPKTLQELTQEILKKVPISKKYSNYLAEQEALLKKWAYPDEFLSPGYYVAREAYEEAIEDEPKDAFITIFDLEDKLENKMRKQEFEREIKKEEEEREMQARKEKIKISLENNKKKLAEDHTVSKKLSKMKSKKAFDWGKAIDFLQGEKENVDVSQNLKTLLEDYRVCKRFDRSNSEKRYELKQKICDLKGIQKIQKKPRRLSRKSVYEERKLQLEEAKKGDTVKSEVDETKQKVERIKRMLDKQQKLGGGIMQAFKAAKDEDLSAEIDKDLLDEEYITTTSGSESEYTYDSPSISSYESFDTETVLKANRLPKDIIPYDSLRITNPENIFDLPIELQGLLHVKENTETQLSSSLDGIFYVEAQGCCLFFYSSEPSIGTRIKKVFNALQRIAKQEAISKPADSIYNLQKVLVLDEHTEVLSNVKTAKEIASLPIEVTAKLMSGSEFLSFLHAKNMPKPEKYKPKNIFMEPSLTRVKLLMLADTTDELRNWSSLIWSRATVRKYMLACENAGLPISEKVVNFFLFSCASVLDLSSIPFYDKIDSILTLAISRHCFIKQLDFSRRRLQKHQLESYVLNLNIILQKIDLSSNELTVESADLLMELIRNTEVSDFILDHNPVFDQSQQAVNFLYSICENLSLENISLANTGLNDYVCWSFYNKVNSVKSLSSGPRSFYLQDNKLSNYGAMYLAMAILKANPKTTQIHLGSMNEDFKEVLTEKIPNIIDRNKIYYKPANGFALCKNNLSSASTIESVLKCCIYKHGRLLTPLWKKNKDDQWTPDLESSELPQNIDIFAKGENAVASVYFELRQAFMLWYGPSSLKDYAFNIPQTKNSPAEEKLGPPIGFLYLKSYRTFIDEKGRLWVTINGTLNNGSDACFTLTCEKETSIADWRNMFACSLGYTQLSSEVDEFGDTIQSLSLYLERPYQETLDLSLAPFNQKVYQIISTLQHNKRINYLNLKGSGVDDALIHSLRLGNLCLKAFSLNTLNISYNNITPDCNLVKFKRLFCNFASCRKLIMDGNPIGDTEEGAGLFLSILYAAPLQHLSFNKCGFGDVLAQTVTLRLGSMPLNEDLTHLGLQEHFISWKVLTPFLEALASRVPSLSQIHMFGINVQQCSIMVKSRPLLKNIKFIYDDSSQILPKRIITERKLRRRQKTDKAKSEDALVDKEVIAKLLQMQIGKGDPKKNEASSAASISRRRLYGLGEPSMVPAPPSTTPASNEAAPSDPAVPDA